MRLLRDRTGPAPDVFLFLSLMPITDPDKLLGRLHGHLLVAVTVYLASLVAICCLTQPPFRDVEFSVALAAST
jgi:hypothetical protein